MKQRGMEPVHALEIPIGDIALLVPSACIAEVINPGDLSPLPCAPSWVVGVIGWRSRAVPVVSFERLLDKPQSASTARSKFIVLYPLPGCKPWKFFAIQSTIEPQTHILDGTDTPATSADLPDNRFFAMGLKLGSGVLAIPDFAALKAALYP